MRNPLTEDDPIYRKVMALDLSAAKARLVKLRFPMEDCDPDWIEKEPCGICHRCSFFEATKISFAGLRYCWYLDLRARYPDETLVPFNDRVEAFWGQHAADPAAYEADCLMLFGKTLPRDLPAKGTEEYRKAAERTAELFLATYPQRTEPWPPDDVDFGLS